MCVWKFKMKLSTKIQKFGWRREMWRERWGKQANYRRRSIQPPSPGFINIFQTEVKMSRFPQTTIRTHQHFGQRYTVKVDSNIFNNVSFLTVLSIFETILHRLRTVCQMRDGKHRPEKKSQIPQTSRIWTSATDMLFPIFLTNAI